MRTAISALFVLAALVLGLIALPAAWIATHVVEQDGFVELASPLADDGEFAGALSAALAEEATAQELPAEVADLVRPLVADTAEGITGLPGFDEAWDDSLRRSHALTFDDGQNQQDGVQTSGLTLDIAPLIALVASEIGNSLGVEVSVPGQALVSVADGIQRDSLARAAAVVELWPAFALASVACAVIGLVAARRRSTTLAFLGLGVLIVGGALWLAAGSAPVLTDGIAGANAVADLFTEALVARASVDFRAWCLAAMAAGVLLLAGGVVGRLLSGSRR